MNLFRKRYRRAKLAVRRTVGLAPSNDEFSDADDRQVVPGTSLRRSRRGNERRWC